MARPCSPWRVMRRMLILVSLLLTAGCAVDAPDPQVISIPKTWTVLVYLDGNNSLGGDALSDFAEMQKATPSTYVTTLVQLAVAGSTTQRYRIANGTTEKLADLGQVNMASAATLADFAAWGTKTAPADRTVLILWDHGNGWDVQQDGTAKRVPKTAYAMLNDDPAKAPFLPNVTIRQALEQSGIRPDVMGFDGCAMDTIEAFYEFRSIAPILIGSQDLEPASGWDYTAILSSLAANPGQSTETFSAGVVASYRASVSGTTAGQFATLAAIRSSALQPLVDEVNRLAVRLRQGLADPLTKTSTTALMTTARATAQSLDLFSQPYVYVDLAGVALKLDPASTIPALVNNTLIAEFHGAERPGAHGISIVFFLMPQAKDYYSPYYTYYRNYDAQTGTGSSCSFIMNYTWDELLTDYEAALGL